tara:strand:- start:2892 stop:3407 length:516 start_codon:yes stop_codon:yes gene_type:complete
MALKLYEYPEAYRELWNRIEAEVDGLSDTDENPVAAGREEFDNLEGDYTEKVENIAKLIRSLTATQDALDTEAARLKARATSIKRKVEWLKGYVLDSMVDLGHTKIDGDVLIVAVSQNERVEIVDESQIPETYCVRTETMRPDKALIRDAIKTGRDVEGAELVTRPSLRIR